MKKGFFAILLCTIMLLCFGVVQAEEKTIENVSTVVGSHCYDGFVPFGAVLVNGDVVVADTGNHRLSVVERTSSKVIKTIGGYGDGKSQFAFPNDVAVFGKNLLVSDSGNRRIVIYGANFELANTIELEKEPIAIAGVGDSIYVLYTNSMDIFDGVSHKLKQTLPLSKKASDFGVIGDKILFTGDETYLYSIADGSFERRKELDGCIAVDGDGKQAYVLFRESYRVLDGDMKQVGGRDLSVVIGEGAICGSGDNVLICDTDGGKVYEFKDDSGAVANYGRGHLRPQVSQVTAEGELAAVGTTDGIELFREGEQVSKIELEEVMDLQFSKGKLFALTRHALTSYVVGDGEKPTLTKENVLGANSAYRFTAMAIDGANIYITEATSGKVLMTTVDFKALTTVISQLNNPSAIAASDGRIYTCDQSGISKFNSAGQSMEHIESKYSALAFYKDTLYALEQNRVARLSPDLEIREPLTYTGYFIKLVDINASDFGIIIGDSARREVMAYTSERLAPKNDNITVDGKQFTGTMQQGKTLTIRVTGAGNVNPMPKIGDMRYVPDVAYIDTRVDFRRDGSSYVSTINLQNVGNYTLKVAYKKQVFISGRWQDVSTADSNPTYELPVGVLAEQVVNTDEQVKQVYEVFNIILSFFKS